MPDQPQPHHHRHLPMPIRIVRARPRLFISAVIGLAVIALCPSDWRIATRLLVAGISALRSISGFCCA